MIREQPEAERLTLPTGSSVFRRGEQVQFVYVVERGLMELSSGPLNRMRFGSGDVFLYEDLVESAVYHSRDSKALTPVSLIRLNKSDFLSLIYRHPTFVLQLLSCQHNRLRQQRVDARFFY